MSAITNGIVGDTLQVIATPPKAHSARLDPEGRFLYAACLGGDVVLAQRFDGAALDPAPYPAATLQPGAGPRHLAFHQDRLYVLNELDGSIGAYARNGETGALRELQRITVLERPASGSVAAADLHLTPDGRFLYASERTTHVLAGFRVDAATGTLALIGHVPSEETPRGFAIDPQGKFLLCAGLTSGRVATYAIDPASGALHRASAVAAGAGPNWIEVVEIDTPGSSA